MVGSCSGRRGGIYSIGMVAEVVMSLVDEQLHGAVSEALEKLHQEDITNESEMKAVDGLLERYSASPFQEVAGWSSSLK